MGHTSKKRMLVAGPRSAQPFLDQIAGSLGKASAEVNVAYELNRPADFDGWEKIDILVVFAMACSARDLARATSLRSIVVPSLGTEGIDLEAAAARRIAVANGRVEENFETVSEAAVLFMLMALYDVHETERRLRSSEVRSGPTRARMLKGKTVGIIGFGNIAKALVKRLRGWGVTIMVHSRSPIDKQFPECIPCDLQSLLTASDIVVPLVPLTDQTRHLLSRDRLLAMKQGAILVNLSRGGVIDEAALSDPEVVAHIGPVALDVFEVEPLPLESPLRNRPDAVLTGHDVSHTAENLAALFRATMANVHAAIAGEAMPTAIS